MGKEEQTGDGKLTPWENKEEHVFDVAEGIWWW